MQSDAQKECERDARETEEAARCPVRLAVRGRGKFVADAHTSEGCINIRIDSPTNPELFCEVLLTEPDLIRLLAQVKETSGV